MESSPDKSAFSGNVAGNRDVLVRLAYLVDFVDIDYSALRLFYIVVCVLEQAEQEVLYVFADVPGFCNGRGVAYCKRHFQLAGQGAGQQRLAAARRAAHHHVVASGGRHVVYAAAGVHGLDLYVTTRSLVTGAWSLPRSITDDSPFDYHHHPSISDDGQRVLFDCGAEPFGVESSAICEVGLDGKGFRPVVEPLDGPADLARPISATHHADYAPDGSIVFESDWGGESIWRLRPGDRALGQVGDTRNDNSPCVLWDGRIASLWLQRPGGASTHEIKVTDPMGRSPVMVQTDVDVMDVGISCSR